MSKWEIVESENPKDHTITLEKDGEVVASGMAYESALLYIAMYAASGDHIYGLTDDGTGQFVEMSSVLISEWLE